MANQRRPGSGGTATRLTKAERKEQARRQRLEIERRMASRRRARSIAIGLVVVVVLAVAGLVTVSSRGKNEGGPSAQPSLAGLQTGAAPWDANLATLADRAAHLNLPAFGNPLALHWHAHLDLYVDGQPVTVPQDVGFGPDVQTSLHTHDDSGVIHMESSDPTGTFTLGEFFDVWGVRLTSSCVGGYCDTADRTIRVFVDGKAYRGDPRAVRLTDHEEIVLAYGTLEQLPKPVPKTYDWAKLAP
jgi:hypothetical protein